MEDYPTGCQVGPWEKVGDYPTGCQVGPWEKVEDYPTGCQVGPWEKVEDYPPNYQAREDSALSPGLPGRRKRRTIHRVDG